MDLAVDLHRVRGLPDIGGLLGDLNDARKAAAYGDVDRPDLNAERLASDIEEYVNAVRVLIEPESADA